MIEYTIKIPIPTINKKNSKAIYSLNSHNRTHYRSYSSIKNKYKGIYLTELEKHDKVPLRNAKLQYELWIRNNRPIDLDNSIFVKKFLQDVMVENGYLNEDNCFHITKNCEVFGGVDKEAEYSYFKVTITGEEDDTKSRRDIKDYEREWI